jgi:hypothetical protein
MIRKIIIACAVALSLGGCAEFQKLQNGFALVTGPIVTPQQVVIAINAFDAVEATATNYLHLPRCPSASICRDPAITAKLVPAIRAGRADRNTLKAALRANPGQNLSLANVYNDLGSTTSLIVSLAKSN